MKYKTCFVALFTLSIIKSFAQISLYDPDVQNFTLKGDSFYVETEVTSVNRHKKIKPNDMRIYTWGFAGQIQSSQGGYAGRLLHGDYTSINNDHSLREQGAYWYGLKDKEWKYWNANGRMRKLVTWKRGVLSGDFADFDEEGNMLRYGTNRKNQLQGKVVYYVQNKPSKVEYYSHGTLQSVDTIAVPVIQITKVSEPVKKLNKQKADLEKRIDAKDKRRE